MHRSCTHDLERLSPTRGPQIPTNQMPRSFLSMLSAERIFSLVSIQLFSFKIKYLCTF